MKRIILSVIILQLSVFKVGIAFAGEEAKAVTKNEGVSISYTSLVGQLLSNSWDPLLR